MTSHLKFLMRLSCAGFVSMLLSLMLRGESSLLEAIYEHLTGRVSASSQLTAALELMRCSFDMLNAVLDFDSPCPSREPGYVEEFG